MIGYWNLLWKYECGHNLIAGFRITAVKLCKSVTSITPKITANPFEVLPYEVLLTVLSYMEPEELIRMECISKSFQKQTSDDHLWKRFCKNPEQHQTGLGYKEHFKKYLLEEPKKEFDARIQRITSIWSTQDRENKAHFTISVLGPPGVGKTTLLQTYTSNFSENQSYSIPYSKVGIIANIQTEFTLFDSPGNIRESKRLIRGAWLQNIDAVILCFSLADKESFNRIDAFVDLIKAKFVDIPIILAGTKSDLLPNTEPLDIVTSETATDKAEEIGAQFVEVSSMLLSDIEALFEKVIKTSGFTPNQQSVSSQQRT